LKRLWKYFLLACISVLFISACTQKETTSENKLEKVRLAEVTRSLFYAPQYVAISKGFFKEEGLDIDLTTTAGGDKTMTTLLSNGADIALVGSETSVYISVQGANDKVINFAQLTQTDGTFLVSRKKIENFSWDQLKGTDYLGQRKGGMPQMVGEFVLKNRQIDPQKDLNLLQNVDFANIANAFASGTGDFVQLFEPTASILEAEGKGHIVASFGKESGILPYTTFMAKESYLKDKKEVVEKFTRALYKGQQWVDTHSPEEIADAVAEFFKETSKDTMVKVIKRYKEQQSFATNPVLDENEWKRLIDIIKTAGELKENVDYTQLVNTEFANKVITK
jgi:NitT/TauT family transport system substrate-binding protein